MVNAVNAFRRRCGEPTHSPMAGASSATVTPAMAIARPSQLAGEVLTGSQLFPHSNPAVVISRHLNATPPPLADTRAD